MPPLLLVQGEGLVSLAVLQQTIDELTEQRDALMLELRESGVTYADLAADLGVSAQRVFQRVRKLS